MDITWGPLTGDDAEPLAGLLAAVEAEDRVGAHHSPEEMAEDLAGPRVDLPAGTLAVRADARLAGFCLLRTQPSADPAHHIYVWGGVHPAFRRQGHGRRLIDWAVRAAPPLHERRHPGRPLELHCGVYGGHDGHHALLKAAGFTPIRWFLDMVHPLTDLPAVEPPEGVRIVPWSPELDAGTLAVRNEAFRDHWGSTDHTPQSWRQVTGSVTFRRESSFLAVAGGRVVGILLSRFNDAAAGGPREAVVAIVGTLRAWRGRGVAGALVAHALAAFHAQGYDRAALNVDADSSTGAPGVYSRAGFSILRRNTAYAMRP